MYKQGYFALVVDGIVYTGVAEGAAIDMSYFASDGFKCDVHIRCTGYLKQRSVDPDVIEALENGASLCIGADTNANISV